ncbi:MAG: hypothetical protein IPH16_11625 [Haliscomenobacter sp.]|nr:hypothetical protein [Haliscomenobacter sp.]MBK8877703.1 hypothetical protein [Haliscomenobacter sp.]
MKKSVFTFLTLAASMLLFFTACDTTKKMQDTASTAAASDPLMTAWNKNLDGFHAVMSSTFHPAEEGNLAPLKANAATMAEKAASWAKAELPSGMKGKGVEAILKNLADGSKNLADMVKANASDQALTDAITKLHDVFHGIMEAGGSHH